MLRIGRISTTCCQGIARRELLRAGALTAWGISLADLLRLRAAQGQERPPAKAAILLWLWGGPSHLDTFDLKPAAPAEYRGPFRPIATNVPGIEICELLPKLARRADKYSIVRSLAHDSNDHGIGGTIGLTGTSSGGISLGGQVMPGRLEPTWGSILARHRGQTTGLPHFVSLGGTLHQGHRPIAGEGGGVWGRVYDPLRLDYHPTEGVRVPELELIDGLTPDGISARLQLRAALQDLARGLERTAETELQDRFYQQAISLLTSSSAMQVLDLEREPARVRDRYGRFRFGQCCLLARRLVEVGVGFIQVNWSSHVEPIEDAGDGGWDMHDRNFQQMQDRHGWMFDHAVSALIDDLEERGLLESTVVLAMGEFGRTPKINVKAGRDHWEHCYSALVAGGGLRCGQVVGASDRRGEYPAMRPVSPGDLATTVFHLLGIDAPQMSDLGLVPRGDVIEELV